MNNMTRTQLIATAKEQGIKDIDGKPVHMVKSQVIQEAIQNLIPEAKVTMKSRILELGRQGMNKKTIERTMLEEGFDRIRYGYIFVVLKDNGVTVPKAKPGKKAQVQA